MPSRRVQPGAQCLELAGERSQLGQRVATVMMAHNHPSGIARPSEADMRCTREAGQFLRLIGIDLSDHLIFVESGHFSFRNAGLL